MVFIIGVQTITTTETKLLKSIKRYLVAGLIAFLSSAMAQPCLTGWTYRVPVYIDNTTNGFELEDHQVLVTINTQALIVAGKAKIDGGDIRFLDKNGAVLPFWLDQESYNSTASDIWVNVSTIEASVIDTIYLFYGESSSISISDGETTFELFDDFIGSTIDATKWTSCGAGSYDVSGGTATLSSTTTATEKAILTSNETFSTPIILEANIESVSDGIGILGQIDGDEGYAMAYEVDGQPTMRMVKFGADANCYAVSNINPPNNATRSANSIDGIWAFSWFSPNDQNFAWPGQTTVEERDDDEYVLPNAAGVTIGNIDKNGSIEVDWLRVRKYTSNQPTTSLGGEVTSIFDVSASATDIVCEEGEIELTASAVEGATFSWVGPNGFTSADQNPTIASAALTNAGTYTVTATITGGCSSVSASADVAVDPTTVEGVLSGDLTVCEGVDNGTVELNAQTGDIVRWESSLTGLAPWTAIEEDSTVLEYEDLVITTYYRAVVKSGVCDAAISNEVKISVDPTTVSGRVIGSTEKCTDVNNGDLTQVEQVGDIQRWQFSTDTGSTWNDILSTTDIFTFSNLSATTWYRTEIKSGVCEALFSDSAKIGIHPLPVVNFSIEDTCFGFPSSIENTSSIASGSIEHYEWDFSTGESSVAENPVYQFSEPGTFVVSLSAESDKGCKSSSTSSALVNPLPQVDFSFENVCDDEAMDFSQVSFITSGSISSFDWDFGDDLGNSIETDPTYFYTSSGDYSVKLIVESSAGCSDSSTQLVSVYPAASLAFEADSVFLGESTTFINSSYLGGGNLTYDWKFGDGETSNLESPTHEYGSPGSFTVTLISKTNYGCFDTIIQDVTVLSDAKASFTVENVCRYDSAQFVNTSFIASGSLTYEWDFGDGGSSTLENPSHIFSTPGTYLVSLTATSDFGSVSTATEFVTIYPVPQASFTVDAVCDEVEAQFSNTSSISTGTLTYTWDFGDENTSTEKDPINLYSGHGDYTIQLVSMSGFSCSDTAVVPTTVYPRPETNFSVNSACEGFISEFVDETTIASGSITSYTWDFGDGSNSIEQHPDKLFAGPDTYFVKLLTNSDKDCPNDTTIEVKVVTAPIADFSFSNECDQTPISFTNLSSSVEGSLVYTWAMGDDDTLTSQSPSHLYSTSGYYDVTLIARSEFECRDTIAKRVQVYANPTPSAGEDQTVSRGFDVELSVTGNGDLVWSPSATLDDATASNPIATPLETTTYIVSITDTNFCTGSDDITVTVEKDYIVLASNVITPDGNGENDTWYVENIEAYDDSKVMIWDRWGKNILEQDTYLNDWEGTSGTDILPSGEYYYVITFEGSDKMYKGTITLIRGN